MKWNIYHVTWDNGEPCAEDRSERHFVVASKSEQEACAMACIDDFDRKHGNISAELCFENVTIPSMS